MSDWQFKLELKDIFESNGYLSSDDELPKNILHTFLERSKKLLENIKESRWKYHATYLLEQIEGMENSPFVSVGDFNNILDHLYDWGDISLDSNFAGKKLCWISTF